jgi:hypothetical protein
VTDPYHHPGVNQSPFGGGDGPFPGRRVISPNSGGPRAPVRDDGPVGTTGPVESSTGGSIMDKVGRK